MNFLKYIYKTTPKNTISQNPKLAFISDQFLPA